MWMPTGALAPQEKEGEPHTRGRTDTDDGDCHSAEKHAWTASAEETSGGQLVLRALASAGHSYYLRLLRIARSSFTSGAPLRGPASFKRRLTTVVCGVLLSLESLYPPLEGSLCCRECTLS